MGYITLFFTALLIIERLASIVTRYTKTKKDDEMLAQYRKAKSFIFSHANGVFDIVKLLYDTNILKGDGASKMAEYKKQLNDAYFKIEGKTLPDNVLVEAELAAEGIYAGKKLASLAPLTASSPAVEASE